MDAPDAVTPAPADDAAGDGEAHDTNGLNRKNP
jgi:hypothetical protein